MCGGERNACRLLGGGFVDRLGGDQQPEVDRRDEGLDHLRRIGAARQFAPLDRACNHRLRPPQTTVEDLALGVGDLRIGCGTGQTSRLAARRAARGQVVGVDLSAPMLERARATAAAEGIANATFEQGDVQVHPFPPAGFDVAISRFGVMFFADPVAAFANVGRALRPGGRLAFLCMGEIGRNEWMSVFSAMRDHVPVLDDARPGDPGMFSLAEPDRIRDVLDSAGFESITTTPAEAPMRFGRDAEDTTWFLLSSGPVRYALDQSDPAGRHGARRAITTALDPFERSDGLWLRGSSWLVSAARP